MAQTDFQNIIELLVEKQRSSASPSCPHSPQSFIYTDILLHVSSANLYLLSGQRSRIHARLLYIFNNGGGFNAVHLDNSRLYVGGDPDLGGLSYTAFTFWW